MLARICRLVGSAWRIYGELEIRVEAGHPKTNCLERLAQQYLSVRDIYDLRWVDGAVASSVSYIDMDCLRGILRAEGNARKIFAFAGYYRETRFCPFPDLARAAAVRNVKSRTLHKQALWNMTTQS